VKGRLRKLAPMVRSVDTRTTPLPPKVKDPVYNSPEFMAWRILVLRRAGRRCEHVDHQGHRCSRTSPEHRLYADHV